MPKVKWTTFSEIHPDSEYLAFANVGELKSSWSYFIGCCQFQFTVLAYAMTYANPEKLTTQEIVTRPQFPVHARTC